MNIIINKFNLPEDIENEIKPFIYDRQGYTHSERECIEKLKESNKKIMLNIKLELISWCISGLSLAWLRPRVGKKSGFFSSNTDIQVSLNFCYSNNLITRDQWLSLGGNPHDFYF